jgi:hypothetical protein
MSEVLSPFQIAKAWGVDDRDIGDFLEKEGVKPVHSFKYGKGMCRLYPKDQALALYAKYASRKRVNKSNDSLSRWNDMAKISADTRESVGRIEEKLDKILSQLGVQ